MEPASPLGPLQSPGLPEILFVGVPRIELGLLAPKASVLPVYYTPFHPFVALREEGLSPAEAREKTATVRKSIYLNIYSIGHPKGQNTKHQLEDCPLEIVLKRLLN